MSEPSAVAELPADLSKPAESIKDAHLDPANNDEDPSSASEGENEDSTPVNGAGSSSHQCSCTSADLSAGLTAKKKKKSAYWLRIALKVEILLLRCSEPKKKKKKAANGTAVQSDPPRVGVSKFYAWNAFPMGATQDYKDEYVYLYCDLRWC